MAVITALELDDLVAPGEAARRTNRGHAGFGAGVAQADLLHARHRGAEQFGHRHLKWIRNAKAGAVLRHLLDCLDDFRVRVAEDRRAPGAGEDEVFVAIDIPHARAFGPPNTHMLAGHSTESPNRRASSS